MQALTPHTRDASPDSCAKRNNCLYESIVRYMSDEGRADRKALVTSSAELVELTEDAACPASAAADAVQTLHLAYPDRPGIIFTLLYLMIANRTVKYRCVKAVLRYLKADEDLDWRPTVTQLFSTYCRHFFNSSDEEALLACLETCLTLVHDAVGDVRTPENVFVHFCHLDADRKDGERVLSYKIADRQAPCVQEALVRLWSDLTRHYEPACYRQVDFAFGASDEPAPSP